MNRRSTGRCRDKTISNRGPACRPDWRRCIVAGRRRRSRRPRSGWVPPAEAGVPVHGRDGAAVAARVGIATACAALAGIRRGPVPGRAVVARPGAAPSSLAPYPARVAEDGLDSGPPDRRPGWPVGDMGGCVRDGPPAGLAGMPALVGPPRAVGRITGVGTTWWMTSRSRPDAPWTGPAPHTTCFLEGTVPDASRIGCITSGT